MTIKVKNMEEVYGDNNVKLPPLKLISESDGSYQASQTRPFITNVPILQYPVNRLNLFEQLQYDNMLDSMYKDNTIFTAYDLHGRKYDQMSSMISKIAFGQDSYGLNSDMRANIMMPRSNQDIDEHSHEFVTAEQSLMSRGNDSVKNAVGSGVATMVATLVDNITKGLLVDRGNTIGTPTRSTYKGAEHRTKTYSWRLSPRNDHDLIALLQIIVTFTMLSYGHSHNMTGLDDFVDRTISSIREHFQYIGNKRMRQEDVNLLSTSIIDTFRYVKVMSNPTLWFIRNYNHNSLGMQDTSIFGPANITNIKINRTPDGEFQGFARYPNISSSYDIEITFREAIMHTRETMGLML